MGSNAMEQASELATEEMIELALKLVSKKEYILKVLDTNPNPANGWANLVYRTENGLVFGHVKNGVDEDPRAAACAAAEADVLEWLEAHKDESAERICFDEFRFSTFYGKTICYRHKGIDLTVAAA